jgi:hypothetical protein
MGSARPTTTKSSTVEPSTWHETAIGIAAPAEPAFDSVPSTMLSATVSSYRATAISSTVAAIILHAVSAGAIAELPGQLFSLELLIKSETAAIGADGWTTSEVATVPELRQGTFSIDGRKRFAFRAIF